MLVGVQGGADRRHERRIVLHRWTWCQLAFDQLGKGPGLSKPPRQLHAFQQTPAVARFSQEVELDARRLEGITACQSERPDRSGARDGHTQHDGSPRRTLAGVEKMGRRDLHVEFAWRSLLRVCPEDGAGCRFHFPGLWHQSVYIERKRMVHQPAADRCIGDDGNAQRTQVLCRADA